MMNEREYLQAVSEQIRCKMARDAVRQELKSHIEDQKEAFMAEGMEEQEAKREAVKEMGDPVEAGISLDRIHRPRMEWKILVSAIGLTVLGLLLQYVMKAGLSTENYNYGHLVPYAALGIGIMVAFCYLDYSRIAVYGRLGALAILLVSGVAYFYGVSVNGQSGYIRIVFSFNMNQLLYLYIPFFGGILYSYKGQEKEAVYKSLAWMAAPCFAALAFSNSTLAVCLFFIMMVQLAFVVKKGWIVSSKKGVRGIVGTMMAVPVLCGIFLIWLQRNEASGYLMQLARQTLTESAWIGAGIGGSAEALPDVNSNFIITYVISQYGMAAAILLIGIMGCFVGLLARCCHRQKNQLGKVMGIGCSLVLAVQSAVYVLMNLSLLPATSVSLPLFSYGGTNTVVSFALIGILLSIFRYQNVLPSSLDVRRAAVRRRQAE